MNRFLWGCLILTLLVSCESRKKHTIVPFVDSYTGGVNNEENVSSSEALERCGADTLVVVEDFIPAAADASFLDFLYNFASDEEFQSSRIVFPLSFYNDTVVHRLNKDEWQFDSLINSNDIYSVIFDKEDEIELENDDSLSSVQFDLIYLNDRYIRRYYFELKNSLWFLEAVNKENFARIDDGNEDFYDFYIRFATDSVFQSKRLNSPLLFSTIDPEDDFSVLETTLEPGQWFAFRPPMSSAKLTNLRYGQSETLQSDTKVLELKGFGNGFNNTLYFRRISGKWKLVKFEDLGD